MSDYSIKFAAVIIAVAIIVGALIHGGIYEIHTAGSSPVAYKLNRITGGVWLCAGSEETKLK